MCALQQIDALKNISENLELEKVRLKPLNIIPQEDIVRISNLKNHEDFFVSYNNLFGNQANSPVQFTNLFRLNDRLNNIYEGLKKEYIDRQTEENELVSEYNNISERLNLDLQFYSNNSNDIQNEFLDLINVCLQKMRIKETKNNLIWKRDEIYIPLLQYLNSNRGSNKENDLYSFI
jgi:hypothetical protein